MDERTIAAPENSPLASVARREILRAGAALTVGALAARGAAAQAADASALDAKLLPGFKVEKVKTSGATLHAVKGGSGPPLLLIHGAPLSHLSWFKVAPELAKTYTVIAADLRGYGDSSKPEDGDNHVNYSKRAMAQDQIDLMKHYGFDRFAVVGHDRGGRVAHRLALDHPQAVTRAAVLDIVPTHYLYTHVTKAFVDAYFHWFLYIRPAPFPEKILNGDPAQFGRGPPELREEYARIYRDPAAVHGMCEDYRASAGIDMTYDEADLKAGKKVACPLYTLWASDAAMGRMYDVLGIWKDYASNVQGAAITGGHNMQEGNPAGVLEKLLPFLKG
jgi:haloacetate dehalogenase